MTTPNKPRLVICTTVPDTLAYILAGQPRFLSAHFDVSLISSPAPLLTEYAAQEGVKAYAVPMARGISIWRDLKALWLMYCQLRQLKPDIVHSYTPKAGLICALAGFLCRTPVRIHTFTGLLFPTATGGRQWLLKTLDKLVCRLNTRIVPESRGVQKELRKISSHVGDLIGDGNIAGVDLQYFSAALADVQSAAAQLTAEYRLQRRTMLYLGRLNVDKGLLELTQALAALPAASRPDLLLVGGDDTEAPLPAALKAQLLALPGVHWLGFRQDVRPALLAADFLVLPSYREGFPNVILQAAALGKPSLCSDISGCNEFIRDSDNGWLVPPRDAAMLQRKIAQICALDDATIQAVGHNARLVVQHRFERQGHWQRLLKFYQELIFEVKKTF